MEEMRIHDKPKNFLLGGYWLRAHEMRAQAQNFKQELAIAVLNGIYHCAIYVLLAR